jgi:hypothetical protein
VPDLPKTWLLLLHQIPPSPPYFRAKVLRRLNHFGALAIKNSAYVLPDTDDTTEDFKWLCFEITQEGGEAWLFKVETSFGLSDSALVASFRELRAIEYTQLLDDARQLLQVDTPHSELETARRKLKRRFDEVRKIDFFEAPGRKEFEDNMDTVNRALDLPEREPAPKPALKTLIGRTWVTRRGIKVDRIATAWLIRRFIDSAATIRFVDQDRYKHTAGEIRFDMFEGEFTHEGDLCTFEVVLRHTGLKDLALDAIAEVVHDIDLKDEKYQRPETNGIAAMIGGIATLHADDEHRLEDGTRIFEAAYAGLKTARKS